MAQAQGWRGRFVAGMIRRTVRARFRRVYLSGDFTPTPGPVIFVANHHGWHDGYLMFHLVEHLGIRCLDWIEEYESFPWFRYIGGLPFPSGNSAARAATIRETIRSLNRNDASLVLFAEGVMHRPPDVWPLGRALEVLLKHVPSATVVPVAIQYDMSLHERPEAFLMLGDAICHKNAEEIRAELVELLVRLRLQVDHESERFAILVQGTLDVNERLDVRRLRK